MKSGCFPAFFESAGADVFCMQEIKMRREQADISAAGYHQYWNSAEKPGYAGTALFSRKEPVSVTLGIGLPEYDREGRAITAEFPDFTLVTAYSPNSQDELRRLDFRMGWEDAFRDYLVKLDAVKPVVVCGDLNVAHQEIDLKNPKTNRQHACFTDEERGKMTQLLAGGFVDSFRHLNPDLTGAYTWWSYLRGARERNAGWRLDYFLISTKLLPRLENASIHAGVTGSDHCPVGLELRDA